MAEDAEMVPRPGVWQPAGEPVGDATDVRSTDLDSDVCSICLYEFENGARVVRLQCNHTFHLVCLDDYFEHAERGARGCPTCRGRATVVARFRWVTSEPTQLHDSDVSLHSAFPTFIAPGVDQPVGYYHASTILKGKLAFLVDPGAWTNAGGRKTLMAAASAAIRAGYKVKQRRLPSTLYLQGVGNGYQECN